MFTITSHLEQRVVPDTDLLIRSVILAGSIMVGISVFYHWLKFEGTILGVYMFTEHNEIYVHRIYLSIPAGVVTLLEILGIYRLMEIVLASITGFTAIILPHYMFHLANEESIDLIWAPGLAFYITVFGGVFLVAGAGMKFVQEFHGIH